MSSLVNSQEWKECLDYISRRIKKQSYSTWLRPTCGEPNGDGTFKIGVPNQFVADWVQEHYKDLIQEAFSEVLGNGQEVIFVITGDSEFDDQQSLPLLEPGETKTVTPTNGNGNGHGNGNGNGNGVDQSLNARYRFDSLVVGDFNQFACAASHAVTEAPGLTKYNPLYIYGGTGLGKTHIAQAIGHAIMETYPNKRVMYATSEKFTSDFINAISDRTVSDFTRYYRDVDVLLIDDIQFFTGKEGTQEQFFHTFNTLHQSGKQIVLTSDRPPRDIKGLEERLLSRFSWGLVTDLQAPDLENRTAILYKKLESEGISIPENVTRYIADQIRTNVRELEGALNRLLAYASLKSCDIDLEMARKVLQDTISNRKRPITIDEIQQATAEEFAIEPSMMKVKKKTANVALARQVAMYLARTLTDNSLKGIGSCFGGRDHSTVIHACDTVSRRMAEDPRFRERIDKISAKLLY